MTHQSNLNGVWRKLCPDFVLGIRLYRPFEEGTNHVIKMGKGLNLNIAPEEFGASHAEELTNEDHLIRTAKSGRGRRDPHF